MKNPDFELLKRFKKMRALIGELDLQIDHGNHALGEVLTAFVRAKHNTQMIRDAIRRAN